MTMICDSDTTHLGVLDYEQTFQPMIYCDAHDFTTMTGDLNMSYILLLLYAVELHTGSETGIASLDDTMRYGLAGAIVDDEGGHQVLRHSPCSMVQDQGLSLVRGVTLVTQCRWDEGGVDVVTPCNEQHIRQRSYIATAV